jgi:hypothetical protein
MRKVIHRLPRIVSISFICLIGLFALDVFEEPQWLLALLIHLIPSYVLIILTVIAWKNELLGGILYILAGLIVLGVYQSGMLILAIPPILIGTLFLVSRYFSKK